jgi:hypothetical protein
MTAIEKVDQPRLIAVLGEEQLKCDRAFSRVIAGFHEIVHADAIGRALLVAAMTVDRGAH